jgi:hypothetical protein
MARKIKTSDDFRRGTKQRVIAELCESGISKHSAFEQLRPLVLAQEKPMVFSANVNGHRVAKPIPEQIQELKFSIGRIYADLGRAKNAEWESEETEIPDTPDAEIPDDSEDEQEDEPEEDAPKAAGKDRLKKELEYFLKRIRELSAFCNERARLGEYLDSFGMRPVEQAAKLIPAGIPADVLLLACTMHWAPETRAEAGIDAFDFNTDGQIAPHPGFLKVSREVMKSRNIDPKGKHEMFGYVLLLVENRCPVWLIGPKGTGKSYLAKQVAEYVEFGYAETGMAAGASRGDLLGRYNVGGMARAIALAHLAGNGDSDASETLSGIASGEIRDDFVESEMAVLYGSGGIFNFEEIDRADPGVVITLNNALAGNTLYNSMNGARIDRHGNFVPVATANTFGLGATGAYSSAERMDESVVDRFRMGRLFLPKDEALEEDILFGRL